MPPPPERTIQLVHRVPGRTRFRLPWLREEPEEARRIANQLVERAGLLEVRAQPRTGSILCLHETTLAAETILEELKRITGVQAVLQPGEQAPPPLQVSVNGSAVGSDTLAFFRQLDRDVHRATEGRLDLATLAVVTFAGIGALNTAATGQLPIPPWYSLAWWSFRVLWTVERDALRPKGAAPATAPSQR